MWVGTVRWVIYLGNASMFMRQCPAQIWQGGCACALWVRAYQNAPSHLMYDILVKMLLDLDGIEQDPKFHPEGNALYHSLQVFEIANKYTEDPELLMAALLHDVGKAIDSAHHAEIGAHMLSEVASERVSWLVHHHLDLLRTPRQTRKRFAHTSQLADLEALRRWDLAGRKRKVWVPTPHNAVATLMNLFYHQQLQTELCPPNGVNY